MIYITKGSVDIGIQLNEFYKLKSIKDNFINLEYIFEKKPLKLNFIFKQKSEIVQFKRK